MQFEMSEKRRACSDCGSVGYLMRVGDGGCGGVLCSPWAGAGQLLREDVFGDQGVFYYLEIEHSYAGEIGAVLEGVSEADPGMDRPGGEDLVRYPGLLDLAHDLNGLFRRDRPHVVVARQA